LLKFLPLPFQTRKQLLVGLFNHTGPGDHHHIPAFELRLLQTKAFADYALDTISCYGPACDAGRNNDPDTRIIEPVTARQDSQPSPQQPLSLIIKDTLIFARFDQPAAPAKTPARYAQGSTVVLYGANRTRPFARRFLMT
jgi:hypothetical protein